MKILAFFSFAIVASASSHSPTLDLSLLTNARQQLNQKLVTLSQEVKMNLSLISDNMLTMFSENLMDSITDDLNNKRRSYQEMKNNMKIKKTEPCDAIIGHLTSTYTTMLTVILDCTNMQSEASNSILETLHKLFKNELDKLMIDRISANQCISLECLDKIGSKADSRLHKLRDLKIFNTITNYLELCIHMHDKVNDYQTESLGVTEASLQSCLQHQDI